MTIEEIIAGYREDFVETPQWLAAADAMYEEAARICMEMNTQYHTPEELRRLMARLTGKTIDDTFRLFAPFHTDFGKSISIGRDVFINSGCHFQDQGGIEIGDGVLIGHNVVLATVNHDLLPANNRKNHYAPIRICDHVWIGSNVTVLPGVTIGEWAVAAAGAVITRDVEPYSVAGGVPARRIRRLTEQERGAYNPAQQD